MKRSLFVVGVAVAAISLAQGPEPKLFQITAKVGKTFDYDFNLKMKLLDGGGETGLSAKLKEKLVSEKNGKQTWTMNFDVTSATDSGVFQGASARFKQMDNIKIQRVADAFNRTLKLSAGAEELGGGAASTDLVFPSKPIAAGYSWRTKVDLRGTPAIMKFQFDGFGTYRNRPAARFSGNYEPNPLMESLEPNTYYIDMADGKMLHARGISRVTKHNRQIDFFFEIIRR